MVVLLLLLLLLLLLKRLGEEDCARRVSSCKRTAENRRVIRVVLSVMALREHCSC